jgi:cation diffusion facilitator CzcD-associated flavoprotein CzcO
VAGVSRADPDVAVVGAGPYGLAVAAHLRERGAPFRMFGRPMDSWLRNMPSGMFLKSEGLASSISSPGETFTLERFCRETGRSYGDYGAPIPIDTFTEYGLAFQRELVTDLEPTDVSSVMRPRDDFELLLATGETMKAKRVVVATGLVAHRHVPEVLAGLPEGLVTHTSEHRGFERFAGRTVAVVGGGQSALETAALLRESGAVPRVLVRKPALVWNPKPEPWPRPLRMRLRAPVGGLGAGWRMWIYSELPQTVRLLPYERRAAIGWGVLGPAGGWWLRERVEARIDVLVDHGIVAAREDRGRVELHAEAAGERVAVTADHVIAATGYRFSLDSIDFLDPELRSRIAAVDGAPTLSPTFESSIRGLYFVGIGATPTFGPVMRFVYGTKFAAPRVADALARAAGRKTARWVPHGPRKPSPTEGKAGRPPAPSEH